MCNVTAAAAEDTQLMYRDIYVYDSWADDYVQQMFMLLRSQSERQA